MSKQPDSTLSLCQGTDITTESHPQILLALVPLNLCFWWGGIPMVTLLPMDPFSYGTLSLIWSFSRKWFSFKPGASLF